MHPKEEACTAQDKEMFCFAVLADKVEGTVYSDLTGKFPCQSFAGNQYIFVCYVYTTNAILLRPMKNRTNKSMLDAFQSVYEKLKAANWSPKLHFLDNECLQAIKKIVFGNKSEIQFVEPHNH